MSDDKDQKVYIEGFTPDVFERVQSERLAEFNHYMGLGATAQAGHSLSAYLRSLNRFMGLATEVAQTKIDQNAAERNRVALQRLANHPLVAKRLNPGEPISTAVDAALEVIESFCLKQDIAEKALNDLKSARGCLFDMDNAKLISAGEFVNVCAYIDSAIRALESAKTK